MQSDRPRAEDPARQRLDAFHEAPGRPGNPARWTTGSKMGHGTSPTETSHVWFTIAQGVLTEIYYPRIDSPCTRDLFFVVTGPDGYHSDERTDTEHEVEWLADGVPGCVVTNTCKSGRYRIEKAILTSGEHDVVLQQTRFVPLQGEVGDYRVHVFINPHLAVRGGDNTGWAGEFKGKPMLFAKRGDLALALACSCPFRSASAGYMGRSDGLEDLEQLGRLVRTYDRAELGNVGLIAELDLSGGDAFLVAIGFGLGASEAAYHARSGLLLDFDEAKEAYIRGWRDWQGTLLPLDGEGTEGRDLYRTSTATLRSHTSKGIRGAVASMAVPWGDHRGDEDLIQGAYHLVWSRDLVQHAGALLAMGDHRDAINILLYLRSTQEAEGHWPQNMWLSGEPFWDGIQLDQAAQPILLADLALREGALGPGDRERFWPMIRAAAGYIVGNGASSEQDRWEEETGYNGYTLSTMISSLQVAAEWAEIAGEPELAASWRETADLWNASIEGWLYVKGTALARRLGIDGYYARIMPSEAIAVPKPGQDHARLVGDPPEVNEIPATEIVSVDALAFVRFGLRRADDPRILNTIKAIDAVLKLETPRGPIWHRYNGDKFGEMEDGSAYESSGGIGRAWPLLIGERAHYELIRGDRDAAKALLQAMEAFAGETGLISEQVWDSDDIPECGLHLGRPTGSVMPLLWAHSEYIKLRRSLRDGAAFDLPPQSAARYLNRPSEEESAGGEGERKAG